MIKILLLPLLLITVLSFSACSAYRMEVPQGNVMSQAELNQVRKGMSRDQVQELLGTPLLQDDFNKNRWDYVFYMRQGSGVSKRQGVTVFFSGDTVSDLRVDPAS